MEEQRDIRLLLLLSMEGDDLGLDFAHSNGDGNGQVHDRL